MGLTRRVSGQKVKVRETDGGASVGKRRGSEEGTSMDCGRRELSDYKGEINLMCFEAETVPMKFLANIGERMYA